MWGQQGTKVGRGEDPELGLQTWVGTAASDRRKKRDIWVEEPRVLSLLDPASERCLKDNQDQVSDGNDMHETMEWQGQGCQCNVGKHQHLKPQNGTEK